MKQILFIFLIFLGMNINTDAQDNICGSAAKYRETHQWEDLPGCTGDYIESGDGYNTPKALLAYAKVRFQHFYDAWSNGKLLDDKTDVKYMAFECSKFKRSGLEDKWNEDPDLQVAMPLYEDAYKKAQAAFDNYYDHWKKPLQDIQQDYIYAEMYMGEIEKAFENAKGKTMYGEIASTQRFILKSQIDNIKPILAKTPELKIPEGAVISGSGTIPETTLGDIRNVYLKKWEAYSAQADKKALEAYEAELAPYLKLMSGEKAAEFRKWYGAKMWGVGGKALNTPQEIASSSVWYSTGSALCVICPKWSISGVRFNGMNIQGRIGRQEGYGSFPPTSMFK